MGFFDIRIYIPSFSFPCFVFFFFLWARAGTWARIVFASLSVHQRWRFCSFSALPLDLLHFTALSFASAAFPVVALQSVQIDSC